MLIRDISQFLVLDEDSIKDGLQRIDSNRLGCVFVVQSDGTLVGSLTDGDFRRWLIGSSESSLDVPCGRIANRECKSILLNEIDAAPVAIFDEKIRMIPVVDERRRVIRIAIPRSRDFFIGESEISNSGEVFVIAEIGINHNGSLETARSLIEAAAEAGASCAKFQLRDFSSLYRESGTHVGEDLGAQYTLDLLSESSLTVEQTLKALDYVRECGLVPLCTPWDMVSARILIDFGIPALKVASADLTNHPLLEEMSSTGRPLLVSTGMSTEEEIQQAVGILNASHSQFALLQCSSSYPAPFKDLNLRYMSRLEELGGCHVGYSGHERGHHVPLAAVALGARVIEKHITLNRGSRGNDHRVSLEPREFRSMVQQIREIEASLGNQSPRRITQGEALNRLSLGKSLVASRRLEMGHLVTEQDVSVKSPGRGLQPNFLHKVVGIKLKRAIDEGDFFFPTDIDNSISPARCFEFKQEWGLPVRFHDWRELASQSNPNFLEFHLSYRDMTIDLEGHIDTSMPYGLVVHSPDLFANDLILDLASADLDIRLASIERLQEVIALTRTLTPRFKCDRAPYIVASLGGSTLDRAVDDREKSLMYERVFDSLGKLDLSDVELLPQTLPPYPWYLGGQRHCNLFVDPTETVNFASEADLRICFDIAHTKLATNHARTSFADASETLLSRSAHLHLVDAAGLDDEGLQVLEGEVDWAVLIRQIRRIAPEASFIPEIWQGHVDSGNGFWVALERLENLMNEAE